MTNHEVCLSSAVKPSNINLDIVKTTTTDLNWIDESVFKLSVGPEELWLHKVDHSEVFRQVVLERGS